LAGVAHFQKSLRRFLRPMKRRAMMNYSTMRTDAEESDACMPGASLILGTAWAVTFSLPLWGAMIWACVKLF
jgi:hypothetical protein